MIFVIDDNEIMAECVQVKLPPEMTKIVDDIRVVRISNCEPTSNKSIIIDALKDMHSRIKNDNVSQAG